MHATPGGSACHTRDGGIFARGQKLDSDRDVRDYLEQAHRRALEGVPAKEAEKLVTDVTKGLQSCGCKVADLAAFTSGLHTWFGAWAPSLRWIEPPKLKANRADAVIRGRRMARRWQRSHLTCERLFVDCRAVAG